MPSKIKETVDYVLDYTLEHSTDYLRIRKEIIYILPPKERSAFTRRHKSTRKVVLNDLDKEIMDYTEQTRNVRLFIDESKVHPSDWVYSPYGTNIKKYYEQKRKQKEQESNS